MSFKASSAEHQGGKPESSEARQPSDRVASVFLKSIDVTTLGFLPSSINTSTSSLNHRRLLRKSISASLSPQRKHPQCQKTYPNPPPRTTTPVAAKQQKNAPSHPEANNPHTSNTSSPFPKKPSPPPLPQNTLLPHYHQKS